MFTFHRLSVLLIVVSLVLTGCTQAVPQPPLATTAAPVAATNTPIPLRVERQPTATVVACPAVPYELISQESLFAYLEDLTSIQPYSGWRNSASSGEAEALDYVAGKLSEFSSLQDRGLELERQSFAVYLSTELRDSRLALTIDNREIEVPAEALRGSRYDQQLALYFDSDALPNDSNSDPMTAAGSALIVRDDETMYTLTADELKGRILFLDFSLLDS